MRYRQHVPNFVDAEGYEIQCTSIEDVLNDPRIKKLEQDPKHHRFSISSNEGEWSKSILMHETEDGYHWWVLGYCSLTPEETGLPVWEAKYTPEQLAEMDAEREARKNAPPREPSDFEIQTQAHLKQAFNNIYNDLLKDLITEDTEILKKP